MPHVAELRHHQLVAAGLPIHLVEGGAPDAPTVLFLHGWPQNWSAFEQVMLDLAGQAHVLAIDLPGIGASPMPPDANTKRALARYVKAVITTLGLDAVTLVGHDIGGQIVYAYLRAYPDALRKAVILNVVIPGIAPWTEVLHNPQIWHFAFHAVPELPELLVQGHEAAYFDFFYRALSVNPNAISAAQKRNYAEAYRSHTALHTGFEWYRAFPQDARDNADSNAQNIATPVLYVRGSGERGTIEDYLTGLRQSGLTNVTGHLIAECGHFTADEQPHQLADVLASFIHVGGR